MVDNLLSRFRDRGLVNFADRLLRWRRRARHAHSTRFCVYRLYTGYGLQCRAFDGKAGSLDRGAYSEVSANLACLDPKDGVWYRSARLDRGSLVARALRDAILALYSPRAVTMPAKLFELIDRPRQPRDDRRDEIQEIRPSNDSRDARIRCRLSVDILVSDQEALGAIPKERPTSKICGRGFLGWTRVGTLTFASDGRGNIQAIDRAPVALARHRSVMQSLHIALR